MTQFGLPGTRTIDAAAAASGAAYRIHLAVPDEKPPEAGFPTIYMLDADASFGTLVETLRRGAGRSAATGIGPAVAVGIGYPAGTGRARRRLDYTSGPGAEAPADDGTGGRDEFLRFITAELMPLVACEVPVDAGRSILLGHSLAGFFVLDVLAHDPSAFRSYVALSPSVWWNRVRLEQGFARAAGAVPPPRLMVLVGEWEQALAPWQRGSSDAAETARRRSRRAMIDQAREITAHAARALGPDADVRFQVLPDEDHASVLPAAMARALRFALSDTISDPA